MRPISQRLPHLLRCAQSPGGISSPASRLYTTLALVQGLYYLITGVWSLISIGSFQRVTGPKTDLWLVKTVGVLVGVIGSVLCRAGIQRNSSSDIPLLAAGSAAGLAAIDIIYVAKRRISSIYLLDAAAELILVAGWTLV